MRWIATTLLTISATVLSPVAPAAAAPTVSLVGVGSDDAIAISVAVSQDAFDSAETAWLIAEDIFPEAYGVGPAAAKLGGIPVLGTQRETVPTIVLDELDRLGVDNVALIGGPAAIGDAVADQLRRHGFAVSRYFAEDRFGSAAALSQAAWPDGSSTAVLVDFGLGSGAVAYGGAAATTLGAPLLGVTGDRVPLQTSSELERLGVTTIHVFGLERDIPESLVTQLQDDGYTVRRWREATVHQQLAAFNRSRITSPAEHIVLVPGERELNLWPQDGFVEAAAAIAGYSGPGTAFVMADADVTSAEFVADYAGDSTDITVVGSAVMQPVAGISRLPANVSSSHAQLTVVPSGPTSVTTAWGGVSDGLRTRIAGEDAPGFLSVFETEPASTAFSATSRVGSIALMATVEAGATVTVDFPDIGEAEPTDIVVTIGGVPVQDCNEPAAVCVVDRRADDAKFDASVDLRLGGPIAPAIVSFDAVPRLAGQNRYETAVAVVSSHFPSADRVYLATGEDFADALSAAAAAGHVGAPVLLTRPDALPHLIADELVRLGAKDVVIVGGPNAVSPAVADQVANLPTRPQVSRIEGADRYATAAAVSSSTFAPGASRAFVATGLEFPDALAGTLPAIFSGGPVLLVRPHAIPDATRTELARLRSDVVVVLGGPRAVSESVRAELSAVRISGPTRYDTAVAISAASHPDASSPVVYVATGEKYPDALSGGPAAAQGRDTLLLVPTDGDVPDVVLDEIRRLGASELVILGGDKVVRPTSVARLAAALT